MANEEHLKILRKGVEAWNEWREENDDIIPNLSFADLHKANLREADLSFTDLSFANLSFADFSNANLRFAILRNTNLRFAVLRNTNLHNTVLRDAVLHMADFSFAILSFAVLNFADLNYTDLSYAVLSDADLSYAVFSDAFLNYADLSKADLSFAAIREADLREANLNQVKMGYTLLASIDLRSIKNINDLTTIKHLAPSSISTDILQKSQGEIPEVFLKGCGLEDIEIEYAKLYRPDLTPNQIETIVNKIFDLRNNSTNKFFPVFLSHSWEDKPFTRKMYKALGQKGIRAWLDEEQIKMGYKMIKSISQGISYYDKFVLICSKGALTSWWVDQELEILFNKEQAFNKGRPPSERIDLIIPIAIDNYLFEEWDSPWKPKLLSYNVGDFRNCMEDEAQFNEKIDQLVEALKVYPLNNRPESYLPKRED